MVSLPHLPTPLHALDDAEEDSANNQDNRHPKPLDPLAVIKPPLSNRSGLGVVEELFQNNQSVVPELEMVDLSILQLELAAIHCTWVELVKLQFHLLLSKPSPRLLVVHW
jgi:hypothetical protein